MSVKKSEDSEVGHVPVEMCKCFRARSLETFPSIALIAALQEKKGPWKGQVVMSRKTPLSADVGNSAGYLGGERQRAGMGQGGS